MALQSSTLTFRKNLINNGMSEELAEAVINGVHEVTTGDLAIKADLAKLNTEFKGDIAELKSEFKGDIVELKSELKGDIAELKNELKGDIAELKSEFKGDIVELKSEFKGDIAELKSEMADLPNDVRWIKVIGGTMFSLCVALLIAIAIAVIKLAFFP